MSHFTTIKTQIKDIEILEKSLYELGYDEIKKNNIIRGYLGNKESADLVIKKNNGYDIGFKKEGQVYNIVADFWGVKEKQEVFTQKVMQKYSYNVVKQEALSQGFNISEEISQKDGTIKLVVQRWR